VGETKKCFKKKKKKKMKGWVWWLLPVIPVTREVEIGRIMV
jgi:hypothetical protein